MDAVQLPAPSPTQGLIVRYVGGNCPVQAEGTLHGLPFYFRARGEHWSFSLAATAVGDPLAVRCGEQDGFTFEEGYGDGPYDAGWMTTDEALAFIHRAAALAVREGYGTERPVIDGEGSRDEPSSSNLNEESQTHGS